VSGGVAVRTRLPRAERERQVLEAARELFAERGHAAVTMDEVAAAVGVTKPLLYAYFGNKERLYLACMEPAADTLVAAVVRAVEGTSTPEEALRCGIHAFFAVVDEDRAAWRVLFDESVPTSGAVARSVAERRDRLTGLVVAALLEQLPAPQRDRQRASVEALSAALLGAAEALARWWLRTAAMPAAGAADLLIRTVEPGLARNRSR
jgi:AcrR family transcriptional regulator